jgi:ABC-type transport system involved in multi-copper enzyme maturation permease subunit
MLGPLFLLEWKYASRRSRHRRFRGIYSLLVGAEFALFLFGWALRRWDPLTGHFSPWQVTATVINTYLPLFTLQTLALLLLVTPALAAGTVSDEKARGTFSLLLITRLMSWEIVFTKWLGQTVQMVVLALPVLPVVAFLQGMAGLPPKYVAVWLVESALLAMLFAAVSIMCSVAARRTTTAILAAYLLLVGVPAGAWWAGIGVLDHLSWMSPGRLASAEWASLMVVIAGLTVATLGLAAWRLRPACLAAERPVRRRWTWWRVRPPVSDNPVRWKERYVGELGLFAVARRVPRWVWLMLLPAGGIAMSFAHAREVTFLAHGVGMIIVFGLFVAVRSSGAVSRERERQTWEGLLITPLEPYALVRGKLWGIIDSIKPYLLVYFLGAMMWAIGYAFDRFWHREFWAGVWAVLCTSVCWLSAWAFVYFQAANGIYHSARCASTLRATVQAVWTGGTAMFTGAALPIGVVASCLLPLLPGFGTLTYYAIALLALVALICVFMLTRAELLLQQAEGHIAAQERIVQGPGRLDQMMRLHGRAKPYFEKGSP